MGNELSGGSYQELEGMKKYAGFSPGQVEIIREKFDLMADEDLTLNKEAFTKLMKVKNEEADKIFDFFDIDQSNRIDSYEFICGLALLSQADLKGKSELIFNLYDFDKNRTITSNELVILIKTTMTALNAMATRPEATIQEAEQKQKEILQNYDTNKDGTISLKEFQSFVSKDPDILKMLYTYGLISKEDLRPDFGFGGDDMPDCDSDLENEIQKAMEERDERVERITNGIEHNETYEDDDDEKLLNKEEDEVQQAPWQKSIKNLIPSDYKPHKGESNSPAVALEIDYVHGFRCFDTRNNIKYSPKGELIYHTAAIGIVLDTQSNTQRYFLEHNDDIVCLDSFENKVVTGQLGLNPLICVWDSDNCNSLIVFRGVLKNGIGNVCFSSDGKKIAACALDEEHSIAVYDVEKAIFSRQNPSKKNNEEWLISTGKLTRSPIFDLRFDAQDKQIIAAGLREIFFISIEAGGVLKKSYAIWDKSNPLQSVLCIGFVESFTVTGMFKGQLLMWNKNRLTSSTQGHSGPVTSIITRKGAQKGIITAGRDGVIHIWDNNIKNPQKIDIKDFRFFSNRITAIAEFNGKLAIGTRSSEIAELSLTGQSKQKIVVKGHFDGELWGLAIHSKAPQFFSVGEDNLLACWDIKKRTMLLGVKLDFPAKAMHMSPNGKYLAVGCTNGSVLIVDPKSLVVTFTFKDRDKEVSCIKFSPDNDSLAVAYGAPSCEILIYSVRQHFKNEQKLRGSTSRVTHLDFSNDSKTLMCNNARFELLFFDLTTGKLNTKLENLKDERWNSWTCIFGWQVQGIWPPCSMGLDINSVDRTSGANGSCLVTADDFSKIKVFKYPSSKPHSSFVKYSGHSAQITNVRFSNDCDHIISTGGNEKSIIVWRYLYDAQGQKEQDDINLSIPEDNEEIKEEDEEQVDDGAMIKPYHGQVVGSVPSSHDSQAKIENKIPDQNLTLNYVHGFRSFYNKDECRGMCKYLSNSKIAFGAAALGVVQDPKAKNAQTFFQKHKEDVVSLAIHPKGNIVATGQMALGGNSKVIDIYIWDADSKSVIGHINDFHRKAVVHLDFSPDGTLLLTAGQDEDNSIAVYDWQSSRIVATSKVDKSKVNCSAWKNNTDFVTVGARHVKFWQLQGRNIRCKNGTFLKKFEPQISCAYAFNNDVCVTGGVDGNIYVWQENFSASNAIQAHKGKVSQLVPAKNQALYSAGYDGLVISWALNSNGQLQETQRVADLAKLDKFNIAIVSLDLKNDMILVGTKGSEIIELKQGGTNANIIQQGHYEGELWGLATSPNSNEFITCGGDKVLRLWDIETHKQIGQSKPFDNEVRACDWNNDIIVVGDFKANIYLMKKLPGNQIAELDRKPSKFTGQKVKKGAYWIEDIKISPDGTKVAFGAHGGPSHVEVFEITDDKFGKQQIINSTLTASLNHLDWNKESNFLVINSTAYELKFIQLQSGGKGKDVPPGTARDETWSTWTCTYGWMSQGIFPKIDGIGVNTCCRNKNVRNTKDKWVLATGDDYGRINLYSCPALAKKQVHKTYLGHSSRVTRVKFNLDDKYLISVGGQDKTILVWETDINLGKEEDELDDQKVEDQEEKEGSELQFLQNKVWKKGAQKFGKGAKPKKAQNEDDIFAEEEVDKGDEFTNVKPWLGALKEPSAYYKDPLNQNKKPPIDMNLEFVFGYSAKNCKSNIRYLKNGGIVYFAASLGIIYDTNTTSSSQNAVLQRFFTYHTDDITCLDLHPDGIKVATGQIGRKPLICVWDSNTLHAICQFQGALTQGVACLAFTPNGDKLAAVAIDTYHEIAIFDTTAKSRTGGVLLNKVKSGPEVVLDIKWKNDYELATAGIKHMKIWTVSNTNIKAKRGLFGKVPNRNLLCLTSNADDYVAGVQDGSIYIFKPNQACQVKESLHTRPVETVTFVNNYLVTGGRDGRINILDKNYNFLVKVLEDQFSKNSFCTEIKAVHLSPQNKFLIVGTAGSEIFELSTKDLKISNATKYSNPKRLISGHYAPNKQTENELWGLAVFNDNEHFASCSDDGTLRIWSISQKKLVKSKKVDIDDKQMPLALDHRTNDLSDSAKARALAISNNGDLIVVGFKDGIVKIYDKDLDQKYYIKCAKECISDIKFCPNDELIAIGSHDNAIYIYSKQEMKPKFKPLRKHSSYITKLDFTAKGSHLHSNCGAYELLFWDVGEKGGKQLTSGASLLRDEAWQTLTTPLSWPTQGIWPQYADGTDINTVDRSHFTYSKQEGPPDNYHLLATGDDSSKVKVFRYPCIKKNSQFVEGKGHSSHVTQVKWSVDDRYLFSTGGGDNCVFMWRVNRNK